MLFQVELNVNEAASSRIHSFTMRGYFKIFMHSKWILAFTLVQLHFNFLSVQTFDHNSVVALFPNVKSRAKSIIFCIHHVSSSVIVAVD